MLSVSILLSSKAPSTIAAYSQVLRDFQQFAHKHVFTSLSANPIHVVLYLEYRRAKGLSPASLASSLYGISWLHRMCDLSPPSESAVCRAFLEGAKRVPPLNVGLLQRPQMFSWLFMKLPCHLGILLYTCN